MYKIFKIELDNIKIDNYEEILSKFSNWKRYKREINLNQLLEEGKKIQFDVEITNNESAFYVGVSEVEFESPPKSLRLPKSGLVNVCSVVTKLTFIILNNKILKLEVELKFLTTNWGKIIKNIIESGLELKLNQNLNIKGQIDGFYFSLPKQAA